MGLRSFLFQPPASKVQEEKNKITEFIEDEPESLDEALVDLRQKYLDEEDRRRDIETKATGILAVSGFLLALLQVFQGMISQTVVTTSGLLLLCSTLLSIANLVPIRYLSPDCGTILNSAFENKMLYTQKMYIEYHVDLYNNRYVNDQRILILSFSYLPLIFAVLVLAVVLLITTGSEPISNASTGLTV